MRKISLDGRHVVITGGSSGIGKSAALATAARGATVFLVARRGAELDEVVAEIRAAGGKAHGYQGDVTDTESVDKVVTAILDEHGHVDMLVNNAGRSIRRSLYRSTDRLHDFERTMAVNYFGALRMTLALLPSMRERKFGHIVQISSAGVQVATPRFGAYLASKAALDKFTEVAAAETIADGITFTTIHMPLVKTPMIAPSSDVEGTPSRSPEWAAGLIMRALTTRPKRIDTPTGTYAEYAGLLMPRSKDRVMHRYYRAFPDSAAAKGAAPSESADDSGPRRRPPAAGRALLTLGTTLERGMARVGRYLPGLHW